MSKKAWSIAPIDFNIEVLKDFDELTKKIVGFGVQRLILGSAVDSGAFRGNMRVTVDSPDMGFNKDMIDAGGMQTIIKAGQVMGAVKYTVGKVIYIQNNAPYAERLENGWSQQQPSNLFKLTFQAMANRFN